MATRHLMLILPALGWFVAVPALAHHGPARADTSGCGKSHEEGYHNDGGDGFIFETPGQNRRYTVSVPHDYDPDRQYPLIVDYHGHGSTHNKQHDLTQYDRNLKGRLNFIVAYPQGLPDEKGENAWEGAPYAVSGANDLQFTAKLLAHFRENYCIDSERIYASGKSNGGGFVGTLACSQEGGEFAAFAASSAALYTDNKAPHSSTYRNCTPSRKHIPILEVHGSADSTIQYNGSDNDKGKVLPSIADWLRTWAWRDGCAGGLKSREYDDYSTLSWSCPNMPDIVKGYHVDNFGHCWPTTGWNEESSKESCKYSPIDFTAIALDFFGSWDINGHMSSCR